MVDPSQRADIYVPDYAPNPFLLESFTDRFLWSLSQPLVDASSGDPHGALTIQNESSAEYIFSDELVADARAAASYSFSRASQPASTLQSEGDNVDIPTERGITLYCPHQGGYSVIDWVVKSVAAHERADVLVLDALELAAGKYGAFGAEGVSAIDFVYETSKPKGSKSEDSQPEDLKSDSPNISSIDTEHIQGFFDALVNIPSKSIPEGNIEGWESQEPQPRRRIIYMRDFGSIAPAAKPLMAHILRAIHNCRISDNARSIKPRVTILIMGVTPAMGLAKVVCSCGDDNCCVDSRRRDEEHAALRAGGHMLRQIVPPVGSMCPVSDSISPVPLSGLSSQLFLPLVVNPVELQYEDLSVDPLWGEKLTNWYRMNVILERTKEINDTLLTICLGQRGGLVYEKPSHALLAESTERSLQDRFQSSFLSPSDADVISIMTISLSSPNSSSPWEPIPVSSSKIADAYQVFLKNERSRADWVDAEKATQAHTRRDTKEKQNPGKENDDSIVKQVRRSSDLSTHERALLRCIVNPASLSTTFENVCIDPKVKATLRTVISLPLSHPNYFKTGILAKEAITGVLLYGPPGTGKTMLCRALAHDCDARMLLVKPSDIYDKWVGESEKNARSLFSLACRLAPCVVFIDEVDALFVARNNPDSHSSWRRDVLTEFMQAMDGLQSAQTNKEKGVVVVGATNRPFDIDQAILRRLPCHLMVDLPGERERQNILKVHLCGETLDDDIDLANIANITEGYSGSDLKNLSVSAAMASVKDAIGNFNEKSHKMEAGPNGQTTEAGIEASKAATDTSIDTVHHVIRMAHFDQAFTEIVPSFSERASSELYRWHKKFSPPSPAVRDIHLRGRKAHGTTSANVPALGTDGSRSTDQRTMFYHG